MRQQFQFIDFFLVFDSLKKTLDKLTKLRRYSLFDFNSALESRVTVSHYLFIEFRKKAHKKQVLDLINTYIKIEKF